MKRIGILALVLSLALTAFAACSFPSADSSQSLPSTDSSSQSEDSATDNTTDDSTDSATDNSTDSSSDSATDGSSADSSTDSATDDSTDDSSNEDGSTDGEEKQIYYTVQFDTDGGSAVASVTVLSGEKLSQPATPTKITQDCEYVFVGWYYNGEQWDFENGVVTQDVTLTARWEEGEKYSDPFLPKD